MKGEFLKHEELADPLLTWTIQLYHCSSILMSSPYPFKFSDMLDSYLLFTHIYPLCLYLQFNHKNFAILLILTFRGLLNNRSCTWWGDQSWTKHFFFRCVGLHLFFKLMVATEVTVLFSVCWAVGCPTFQWRGPFFSSAAARRQRTERQVLRVYSTTRQSHSSAIDGLKGTVARDFLTLVFSLIDPIWAPDSHSKIFLNSVLNSRRYSYSKVKIRESALSDTALIPNQCFRIQRYFWINVVG